MKKQPPKNRVSPYATDCSSNSDVTPKSRFYKVHDNPLAPPSSNREVVSVLREITSTLNYLVKRVESTENGLKKVQDKLEQSNSSSCGESAKSKDEVPLIVRVGTLRAILYNGIFCSNQSLMCVWAGGQNIRL